VGLRFQTQELRASIFNKLLNYTFFGTENAWTVIRWLQKRNRMAALKLIAHIS